VDSPSPKNSTIKVLKDDIRLTDAKMDEPVISSRKNLDSDLDEYGKNSSQKNT
jgi:hypothetical protein